MPKNKLFILAVSLLLLLKPFASSSQVRLPQLITDKMVLQRDTIINLWGWAAPSEKVSVSFNGKKYKTVAASDGTWQVRLSPMKAGGPYTMDIRASNHIILDDILIGDVWFCSGQSNMVLPMERVKEKYPEEIAGADFPQIRNFFVPTVSDVGKIHDDLPPGKWMEATPKNVLGFGAATFFFAKQLYQQYHVPIGIINSSVGGTPIQAWISAEGLKDLSSYADRVKQFRDTSFLNRVNHFIGTVNPEGRTIRHRDQGLTEPVKWYEPNCTPQGWHKFWLPGFWADQGVKGLNGIVWFRKEIDIPAFMAGKPAKLFVGRIIDADETYVNGVKVGNITYQYPPRRYEIPEGLLKAGKNLLVVRVTNTAGKGGFEPDKRYELTDGVTHIDIRGDWQYKVGQVFPPRSFGGGGGGSSGGGAPPFSAQDEPTGLYNTMVAPAIKATIKGFVWYQGEANTGNPQDYCQLLPALIADWRNKWRMGDLPFLYVQLPNFMEMQYSPSESQWAELRDAQLNALSVPRTGMAVTIDAGEWNDIHPLDKKDVGERLALAARKIAYGEHDLVSSGPIYQSARIDGDKVIITFTDTGGGLLVKGGGELHQFAIAGANKKFVWADARIDGNKVIVYSDEVPNPLYVRYAWADNPEDANLYNKEGLPASPFRTDERPLPYPPPVTFTAQQDHDDMMKQLGIKTLRPGPSGDEKAPNHANYDTALANPYPNLPDVLSLKNGKMVNTPTLWWNQRRPEIVEDFEREVYGRIPAVVPRVTWTTKVTDQEYVGFTPVIAKQLIGHVDNSAYPLIDVNINMTLVLPAGAKAPVPVLMMFARSALPSPAQPPAEDVEKINAAIKQLLLKDHPELQQIFDRYPTYTPIAAQTPPGFGLPRSAGDPPTAQQLISGGWGYILIDPNSAKLNRRNWGEAVESLTGGEYYWMAGNFMKYGASEATFGAKTAKDLPVDAHELIALCAPRLTFISYGVSEQGDAKWLDHQGSYMAAVAAGPVFKLLGAKDLGVSNNYQTEKMPAVNVGLLDGQLAWRQHDGGHSARL